MTTCPGWCTEQHDPETEARFGDVDPAASILHDLGGPYVGLHRLDRHGQPGRVTVVLDPGPSTTTTPEHAARFAVAVDLANVVACGF